MERKEAISLGLVKYDTGRPCKHGHSGHRDTVSAACLECVRLAGKNARNKAKQAIAAAQAK